MTPRTATGTTSSVTTSTTSATILAANANRLGATVFNDSSSSVLYLKLASGAASSSDFTVRMAPYTYYEVPFVYSGVIAGILDTGSANARVTEFT